MALGELGLGIGQVVADLQIASNFLYHMLVLKVEKHWRGKGGSELGSM